MENLEFEPFRKIARLNRDCVVSEKIDGTSGQIYIFDLNGAPAMKVGSRTQWLSKEKDNSGFFNWCMENREDLLKLGYGRHYGEWWGGKIQRGYGLKEKRFSLFNTSVWSLDNVPKCCSVVPVLYSGLFSSSEVNYQVQQLRERGSVAAPGYPNPEGVVVFHMAAGLYFKATCKDDGKPKGMVGEGA